MDQERLWKTAPELWEKVKPLARQKRHKPMLAENCLWEHFRNRQVLNFKFRRQHCIDKFIVDFYCAEAWLVIEVDGPIHDYTHEEDIIRQQFLESGGLTVLRFPNEEVLNSLETVIEQIIAFLQKVRTPSATSPSLHSGEGVRG